MICNHCGKKNKQNIKFCINCGAELNKKILGVCEKKSKTLKKQTVSYKKISQKKKLYENKNILISIIIVLSLLISICAGIIVGFLNKNKININKVTTKIEEPTSSKKDNKIEIVDIFVKNLNKYGSAYIKEDTITSTVNSTIKIETKVSKDGDDLNINDIVLDYKLENESLLDFKVDNNIFIGTPIKSGITEVYISYDNEIIKKLTLIIKESEEEVKEPTQVSEKKEEIKKQEYESAKEKEKEEQTDIIDVEDSIEDDEYIVTQQDAEKKIYDLQLKYEQAIKTGKLELVYSCITKTGNLYKSYSECIPEWYSDGIRIEIIEKESEYGQMIVEDEKYIVPRTSIAKLYEKNGRVRYRKEYIEFVLVYQNGSLYVDSCKNYEMIDRNYNY